MRVAEGHGRDTRGKNPQPQNKDMKTPKPHRFISLFSCFSPGHNDTSTASMMSIPSLADNRDLNDSDGDNRKLGKNVQKKASLRSEERRVGKECA